MTKRVFKDTLKTIYLLGALVIFFSISCTELYEDPTLSAPNNILVVEGMITNDTGPYLIKLSKALKFSNTISTKSYPTMAKGATVSINDIGGNLYVLTEKIPGVYTTDKNFRGEIGHSYQLFIKLKEGDEYNSEPCLIHAETFADSVYGEPTEIVKFGKNVIGDYVQEIQNGVNVYMDASPKDEYYLKTSININEEVAYNIQWPPPPRFASYQVPVFCIFRYNSESINLVGSVQNSNNIVKKATTGFINYVDYKPILKGRTDPVSNGYNISLNISSVSRKTYFYLKYMLDQLNAANNLFDPISTQLMGNIHCTSDSSKIALGYFDAASITHKYAFLKWVKGGTALKTKNLDFYPSWQPEMDTIIKPSRWND